MENPIRIMVVDDHSLVRESIVRALNADPDLFVVGTAKNADEAVKAIRSAEPDILLMDVDMPGMACFEAVERIHLIRQEIRVIFLSAFHHDHYIEQAVRVKARGYLTKSESLESMIQAVKKVANGMVSFSDQVMERLVANKSGLGLKQPQRTRSASLSNREIEVLRYVARGLAKKQIATTMHVSIKTVDSHVTRVMSKLDIHDRVELTRFAIREGLAEA